MKSLLCILSLSLISTSAFAYSMDNHRDENGLKAENCGHIDMGLNAKYCDDSDEKTTKTGVTRADLEAQLKLQEQERVEQALQEMEQVEILSGDRAQKKHQELLALIEANKATSEITGQVMPIKEGLSSIFVVRYNTEDGAWTCNLQVSYTGNAKARSCAKTKE